MVKGIQRQVILVPSPDPELFDQAIFILKDSAVRQGITDEMLLKQARAAIGRKKHWSFGKAVFWAAIGACISGIITAALLLL